jgi:hypothetical protein
MRKYKLTYAWQEKIDEIGCYRLRSNQKIEKIGVTFKENLG